MARPAGRGGAGSPGAGSARGGRGTWRWRRSSRATRPRRRSSPPASSASCACLFLPADRDPPRPPSPPPPRPGLGPGGRPCGSGRSWSARATRRTGSPRPPQRVESASGNRSDSRSEASGRSVPRCRRAPGRLEGGAIGAGAGANRSSRGEERKGLTAANACVETAHRQRPPRAQEPVQHDPDRAADPDVVPEPAGAAGRATLDAGGPVPEPVPRDHPAARRDPRPLADPRLLRAQHLHQHGRRAPRRGRRPRRAGAPGPRAAAPCAGGVRRPPPPRAPRPHAAEAGQGQGAAGVSATASLSGSSSGGDGRCLLGPQKGAFFFPLRAAVLRFFGCRGSRAITGSSL